MKQKKRTRAHPALTFSTPKRSVWIVIALAMVSATGAVAVVRSWPLSPGSKVEAGQPMTEAAEAAAFGPTIPNATSVPAPSPHAMVCISGGEYAMAAMDPPTVDEVRMHGAADARPIHRVYVDGLWMDKTAVTNQKLARFVKATGYVNVAECMPLAELFRFAA